VSAPDVARRKRAGSGWSYTIGGEAVQSVSRIVRDGVPSPNLIGWAARTTAGYAVDHWADLEQLTPSKRLAELTKAPNAERDAAAGRGTKIHEYADRLAHGVEVDVPEALVGHVDAYLAFADAYDVEEIATEAAVVYRGPSTRTSYMGTFDLLARLDGVPGVALVDWKTGGSGIWPETALQLCAYSRAQTMLVGDGPDEVPMPKVVAAFAVWLRADGYDVYPVDISDATFRVFQYAQQVARFTAAERAEYVGEALPARAARAAI
jgi:hypothetical protein